MGSPVSPVIANLCIEVIERLAISNSTIPPRIWKGYVDDSFVAFKKDAVTTVHDILNSIDPRILLQNSPRPLQQEFPSPNFRQHMDLHTNAV